MTRRATVLIGHTFWGRGGAEIAAMWVIQALVKKYDVHIITRGGWDLPSLNQASETSVRADEIRAHVLPNLPGGFGAIAHGLMKRAARRIGASYDVRITASGSFDWGRPAIHFLSSVGWNDFLRDRFASDDAPTRRGMLQRGAWALSSVAAGNLLPYGRPDDWYVANSRWSAEISAEFCTDKLRVIYPPVIAQSSPLRSWADREDAIVWLGRISPEKRLEDAIGIVSDVRHSGHRLPLYVVGEFGTDPYSRAMREACQQRSDWVKVCGPLYGAQKQKLLSNCKYGLNTCQIEAFGISTAEMVGSGMIVFVPEQTGQAEIVADPSQYYSDTADAAPTICSVLESPPMQESLHSEAVRSARRFEPNRFMRQVQELVGEFLSNQPQVRSIHSAG